MSRRAVNGVELHYELAGQGSPAIVLVHGGCCAGSDWAQQIEALSGEFTVLAPNLRGHAGSAGADSALTVLQWAADVNALIDALAIGPAVLVGHSLGSRIVAEAAWQRPDNAAALVLLDGSRTVGGLSATEPQPGFAEAQAGATGLEAILDRTIGPHAAPAVREQVIRTMSAAPEAVMWAAVRALEDWDRDRADLVFAALPEGLPVLAIQSTYHDRFTPRRSFARPGETSPYLDHLRAAVPGLEVKILTDTGHFSMMERPQEVTAILRDVALRVAR
jgi:3-oxoadipate enol-lactonase